MAVDHGSPGRADCKPGPRRGQCLSDGVPGSHRAAGRIAANRTELLSLLQANILGQNNAAIAALEAEYAQFWAQDVAAVTGYAGSSQAATNGSGLVHRGTADDQRQWSGHSSRRHRGRRTTPQETILEQIEADASNFLNQVTAFNADYTKFFTTALGSYPRRVHAGHHVDEPVFVHLGRR